MGAVKARERLTGQRVMARPADRPPYDGRKSRVLLQGLTCARTIDDLMRVTGQRDADQVKGLVNALRRRGWVEVVAWQVNTNHRRVAVYQVTRGAGVGRSGAGAAG